MTAKPVVVAKESVTPPAPKPAPVVVPAPIVTAEPAYEPIVQTVPATKPIVASVNSTKQAPAGTSYVNQIDETVCKCSSSPQSSSTITVQKTVKVPAATAQAKKTTVVKQQPVKKFILSQLQKQY